MNDRRLAELQDALPSWADDRDGSNDRNNDEADVDGDGGGDNDYNKDDVNDNNNDDDGTTTMLWQRGRWNDNDGMMMR
jgi:hypothetical protein